MIWVLGASAGILLVLSLAYLLVQAVKLDAAEIDAERGTRKNSDRA